MDGCALMTVEQFQELPLDRGPVAARVALRRGRHLDTPEVQTLQVADATGRPPGGQRRRSLGVVGIEMPFPGGRRSSTFAPRMWRLFASEHWDAIDPEDNLRGAPELVIEVKSASNTWAELREELPLSGKWLSGFLDCR
jgi:hypothetical protein